jgi:hypothetical protein
VIVISANIRCGKRGGGKWGGGKWGGGKRGGGKRAGGKRGVGKRAGGKRGGGKRGGGKRAGGKRGGGKRAGGKRASGNRGLKHIPETGYHDLDFYGIFSIPSAKYLHSNFYYAIATFLLHPFQMIIRRCVVLEITSLVK